MILHMEGREGEPDDQTRVHLNDPATGHTVRIFIGVAWSVKLAGRTCVCSSTFCNAENIITITTHRENINVIKKN